MKFVDETEIEVEAGKGGRGAAHFRREKFVPRGGPDGGDGGCGGSVYARATLSKRTLLDFQYRPRWHAEHGGNGEKNQKYGKNGEDMILELPIGTEIYQLPDAENCSERKFIADLTEDQQDVCLAKGGKGGKGNTFFKSATNQAPMHAQKGLPGEAGRFLLSLKLIADVGLIGLPNAGKSTFLSTVSAAKPKVADYPFTTLEPQLGVVQGPGGSSCVFADIPGLIEGAHHGKGLGLEFLKHVERTSVLVHLIDCYPLVEDPESEQLKVDRITIEEELQHYAGDLMEKPRIFLFTKLDLSPSEWSLDQLKTAAGLPPDTVACAISSATGTGIQDAVTSIFRILNNPS